MKFDLYGLTVSLLILTAAKNHIICDLPVHCLKHDIIGDWAISATDLIPVKSGHEMLCGHDEPTKEESSNLAKSPFELKRFYKLRLKNSNEATLEIEGRTLQGTWTMVYDEGFNVSFEEFTFFAFSKYLIQEENGNTSYKSQCYSTCIGWYNNKDKTKWGCYQAMKLGVDPVIITYTNTKNNLNIVEPTDENSILDSMMNMQFRSVGSKITFNNKKDNRLRKKKENSSFLEEQGLALMKLDSSFNNHAIYISKINTLKKSWNAGLHPNFSNLTIRELNRIAGRPKINSVGTKFRFKSKENKSLEEDVSRFPKKFDWKDKLKPSGSQGNCGSCYVYSTIRMIEARLKILYNHEVNLSVQQALDCSFYNQGCSGGYPFLVMKFANEFNLVPEACKPYTESVGKCDHNYCDLNNLPYIYKTADYKYIGGSYGECSQSKMMEEMYKNGPIVVSFEPDYNFMMYKNGIYHSLEDDTTWIKKGLPRPEWQKVDHSVLLVGWGEDPKTEEKYWIIQNTWGPNWGENGFFRMRRGTDEFGIESICETATPVMINNKTGQALNKSDFMTKLVTNGNLIIGDKNISIQNSDTEASIFDVFK